MALIENPTHADVAKAIIKGGLRSWLIAGPPGVGKTSLMFWLAKHLKMLAHKVQFHNELAPAEILGMYVPKENTFEWMPGPLDVAYSNGDMLILDEIIEASGPCKTLLYGALDDGPGGVISYVGRTFNPSKKYKVGATMNGWPYEGGLPPALLDRFDAVFIVTKPSKPQLETLDKDLKLLCIESYDKAKDPMQGPDVTFRMLQSLQKLRKVLPLPQAVLASCAGDQVLAGAFLEVLSLVDEDDLDEEEYAEEE